MLKPDRLMPAPLDLGKLTHSSIGAAIFNWQNKTHVVPNNFGYREVMGYFIPSWQRGEVWTEAQNISLIESAWLGISIGTITINQADEYGSELDNLLIDGQQRLTAIQKYLSNEFKVFGYYWAELPAPDQRRFSYTTMLPSYHTQTNDGDLLRKFYNLLNFGGAPHLEGEQA